MSYMDTKFCELCDEEYNWAAPECPSCVARNFAYRQEYKMQSIQQEFLYHLNVVQTTLAHLLQDGNVTDSGLDAVNNLLSLTEELQDKHTDELEQYIKNRSERDVQFKIKLNSLGKK